MRKKFFIAGLLLSTVAALCIVGALTLQLHGAVLAILFLVGVYIGFSALMTFVSAILKLNMTDQLDLFYLIIEALAFFKL